MTGIRVLFGQNHNPYWNLAIENWIFRDMDPATNILYLWRNQGTVVIGRFQNPWSECDLAKMQNDDIFLARRQSGGGAVYQDLGNSNFTFMGAKDDKCKTQNFSIITKALEQFGIKAYTSGRNDLLVDDAEGAKKISGSAFKNASDRAFHHGTMLINADLGKLAQYLRPNPKKLQSKGIASVQSRVANLVQYNPAINHDNLAQAIINQFFNFHQKECPIEYINNQDVFHIDAVARYAAQLEDQQWRLGETPRFMQTMDERFDWGCVEVHLDSHKGRITRAQVFSDALFPDMIETLGKSLPDKVYGPDGIASAIAQVIQAHPDQRQALEELQVWLSQQVI